MGFLGRVPLNATFSRAFHGFLPDESARRIHEALKSPVLDPGAIVINSSLDAIAIDGREKAVKSPVSLSLRKGDLSPGEGENISEWRDFPTCSPDIGLSPLTEHLEDVFSGMTIE